MWKYRIYDMDNFWNKNYEEMTLIKETEQKPTTDNVFKVDNKLYRWCAISHENKVVGIEEISFVDEVEEQFDDEFICPYCHSVFQDAWELSDNGTTDCSTCGSEIEFEKEYTVTYRVMPVKRNKIVKL